MLKSKHSCCYPASATVVYLTYGYHSIGPRIVTAEEVQSYICYRRPTSKFPFSLTHQAFPSTEGRIHGMYDAGLHQVFSSTVELMVSSPLPWP